MKKMGTLIQMIFIVLIWYCFYSIGGWKCIGFDGGKMKLILLWVLYVFPMILIGIVLNGTACIRNIKNKKSIEKINLFILAGLILILVIAPLILIEQIPIYDMFSEDMLLKFYRELNFSNVRGMGAYMATALCAGYMIGELSEKPQPRKTLIRYISIIFMWFIVYDILLPMTETITKSGRNYTIATLFTILPMFFAGIVLTYSDKGKSEYRQIDRFHLILFIIMTVLALTIPVVSILMDLKISVYQSQNIVVSIIYFIQANALNLVLWLCVGNLAVRLKEKVI